MEVDLAYYRRRLGEETAAADAAPDLNARRAHLELARRYGEQISKIETQRRRSEMHIVSAA